MVGFSAAAVTARAVGVDPSPAVWLGAFVASGLPDLDFVPVALRLRSRHFHRHATHSIPVLLALAVGGWLALPVVPFAISQDLWLVWTVVLLTHPLLDLLTCGPTAGEEGFGIALGWPFARKRWYLERPLLNTADFPACESVRDVWIGIRPEIVRLGPPSLLVMAAALLI